MKTIDSLIDDLAKQATVSRRAVSLRRLIAGWIAGLIIYMTLIFVLRFFDMRADIADALTHPLYSLELLSLLLILLTTVIVAALSSFPDFCQKPRLIYAPLAAFAVFLAILAVAWIAHPHTVSPLSFPGIRCITYILSLSLPPGIALLLTMRAMATTKPHLACALAVLCAFSVGAFILRLSEQNDSVSHLVIWHYAPMLAIGLIGFWAGPKILKW